MLVCNCTLAGSWACQYCSVYNQEFQKVATMPSINWHYVEMPLQYDSDRYELVEKKDWKINNLKQQIEEKSKLYEEKHAQAVELKEDLELLKKELKELETNNK